MKFFFSTCGSTKSNDSLESKKIHEELSTSRSYDSSKRLTDAAAKSNSEIRDGISVDDAASKSSSGTREGAPVIGDDVSSNIPSKLFAFVSNRNWEGAKSSSGTSDGVSVDDDAAAKSNSEIRDGAPVDDVSSENPTKLFAFVSKRNWAGVAERCSGADKAEATNWIVEHNNDGSIRWRLLPIHQVSSLRV